MAMVRGYKGYTVTLVDKDGVLINSWSIASVDDPDVKHSDYSYPMTHVATKLLGGEIDMEIRKDIERKGRTDGT
jgi:hypothetical protein